MEIFSLVLFVGFFTDYEFLDKVISCYNRVHNILGIFYTFRLYYNFPLVNFTIFVMFIFNKIDLYLEFT